MDTDPSSPVLPTNRAACFFRLNKYSISRRLTGVCSGGAVLMRVCVCRRFAVAESDCNLAIALDTRYIKAYIWRAAARAALHKPQDALEGVKRHHHKSSFMTAHFTHFTFRHIICHVLILSSQSGNRSHIYESCYLHQKFGII